MIGKRATFQHLGPPWVGQITTLSQYDRHWLIVLLLMLTVGTVFFGWWALVTVGMTTSAAMVSYSAAAMPVRLIRGSEAPLQFFHALNLGLLTGLTLPVVPSLWLTLFTGLTVGLLAHVIGRCHRVRIHPVAMTQVILLLAIPFITIQGVSGVLTPQHMIVGDVTQTSTIIRTETWEQLRTTGPFHAARRLDPDQVMIQEQRSILRHPSGMAVLLRRGELVRVQDLLLGATPGPIGGTSRLLIILLGLYLIYKRIGRSSIALSGIGAALLTLLILPLSRVTEWIISAQAFDALGWKASVTYLGYQLLASPLLLIVLILAPETAPRTTLGRVIYGVVIGVGIMTFRWFVPSYNLSYAALVIAGLLTPLLDRVRLNRVTQNAL